MLIPNNCTLVHGPINHTLSQIVKRAGAAGWLDGIDATRYDELLGIVDDFDRAGRAALRASGALPPELPRSPSAPAVCADSAPTSAAVESWLTVADVAQSLGVSERRVRQRAAAGELVAVLHKNRWRFDPAQFQERLAG